MEEVWKDVVGYEGLYQVSNLGRVKSFKRKVVAILKPNFTKKRYTSVDLQKNGTKNKKIHKKEILSSDAISPAELTFCYSLS